MPELTKAPSGPRLRFIDMTRAVAIPLMLLALTPADA